MQKRLLTAALCLLFGLSGFAQFGTCQPDTSFLNSDTLLIPLPFDPDIRPDGGITDSACLNTQFQFNFQFAIPDTFSFGGSSFSVDSFRLENIDGLPQGMTFSCSPDCTFERESVGCVAIFGVATDPADVGEHLLTITGNGFFNGSDFPLTLNFPDENIPELEGEYILTVLEENDDRCTITSDAWEPLPQLSELRAVPNPAFNSTEVVFTSELTGELELRVNAITGQLVHREDVRVVPGENRFSLDLSGYAPGVYLYSVRRGDATVVGRMIVR